VRRSLSDTEKQHLADAVAHATRAGLSQVSPAELDAGWEKLEQALSDGKYPSMPIVKPYVTPWYLRGIVFVSMILGVGFVADWVRYERALKPLHFALEGASVGPEESIQAGADTPAQLVFSDQSRVRLAPTAKVSVLSMDAHGARVALANGDLDVSVKPRQGASWRFEAGPFTVSVKGTAFHLGFDAHRGRLGLQMQEGVVEVAGPSRDRKLTLRAGESLELFSAEPSVTTEHGRGGAPDTLALVTEPPSSSLSNPEATVPAARPSATASQPTATTTRSALHRARPKSAEPSPDGPRLELWSKLIAGGEFGAVVKDAEDRGIDATLARASAAELTSLADAARYTRRYDMARQALLQLRDRFPSSGRSRDAAFFLGRLAETTKSAPSSAAVAWYDTYLREAAAGSYAGDALGREIVLLSRMDRDRARGAARQYLERFPRGSQAELARSLVQSAAE
jgi:hypothetical protein